MARVELTQNKGPEVIESLSPTDSITANIPLYGPIVNVRLYTLHSYQVLNNSGSSITFYIIGSNYADSDGNPSTDYGTHWTTISQHTVSAGNSLAYSDVWNFKYASILVTCTSNITGVSVYEKHNA